MNTSTVRHSLSTLLADRAAATPAATALREPGGDLAYRELAALAGGIQAALTEAGVRPGDRVAVLAPQTAAAVAAVHAVLAAGAAYVPLDPASPPARWAAVCAMSTPRAVVGTGEALAKLTAELPHLPVVDLDVPRPGAALAPVAREAADLGAVLPTSGSTGVPKGVAISREALLAFASWMVDTFEVAADDVLAGFSPLHFDVSVFSLFGSALAGAALAPAPAQLAGFPAELAAWAEEAGITVWYSVPYPLARLGTLDAAVLERRLGRLRTVCFAGEVFPHGRLATLMSRMPWVRYTNLYGPTETNVCTFEPVTAPPAGPVAIGGPACGAECWVERDGERVDAVGEVGELIVAGPTVADGYWGNAEETARRFRFGPRYRSGRAYATGDQVRILPGGRYAYLGRRDHMVKIRGQRLELEEVESVLGTAEGVTGVCVVAVTPPGRPTVLCAAVTGDRLDHAALRSHCRGRLPGWAIPQRFLELPAIPLTSTGKTDRQEVRRRIAAESA